MIQNLPMIRVFRNIKATMQYSDQYKLVLNIQCVMLFVTSITHTVRDRRASALLHGHKQWHIQGRQATLPIGLKMFRSKSPFPV